MGKYTFADALDSRFQSRGIQLAAGLSTLAVSIFYLIPQMVGAGTLVQPLFNLQHAQGVSIVGAVVIVIVVTAGMVSTTYVQFLKGGLLIFFSLILTAMILYRGLSVGANTPDGKPLMTEQSVAVNSSGQKLINGLPQGKGPGKAELPTVGHVASLPDGQTSTGPIGPIRFLSTIQQSEFVLWRKSPATVDDNGTKTEVYKPKIVSGKDVMSPGNLPAFAGIRSDKIYDKLNFLSLMLALFGGTASLPHILIRYYTVRDQSSARKSTIVGISTIGLFYVLTLFMGLGAMASGSLDMTNSNMAAPLLARSFSEWLFAIISAIAFTTVLGTVSGLIIAASGAIVHDLTVNVARIPLNDNQQVRLAKFSSVGIGVIAIALGIVFGKMNVSYLVGWAFSVAASANLPALIMLLFWRGTTRQGITAAILVGMVSSLAWVLLSADTFKDIYGLPPEQAWVPFSQPGLVTIPLGFLTLIVVSLMTPQGRANQVLADAKR
jgi:cation/acetate symporter